MAKDTRSYIALACTECKKKTNKSIINHYVSKNKNNNPDPLELNKFCPVCNKNTLHRETKLKK